MPRDTHRVARLLAGVIYTLAALPVLATPWRPADDATVLVQVPPRNVASPLAIAERDYAANPGDARLVMGVVQALTDAGRRAADPRYFGRAEAILRRLQATQRLTTELQVASADILQHRHDYDAARQSLDAVLRTAPEAVQPRLMRAQLNLAQGRFDEARRDCLALLHSSALGSACLARRSA